MSCRTEGPMSLSYDSLSPTTKREEPEFILQIIEQYTAPNL